VEASLSLIALMALPAVIVGGTVAFFTWNAQRAARALLLSELLLAGPAPLIPPFRKCPTKRPYDQCGASCPDLSKVV
jgi:hypothetical protein